MAGRRRRARGKKRATPFYNRDRRVGEGSAFAVKGCPTIYTAVRRRASASVRAQGRTAGGPVGTAGCGDAVSVGAPRGGEARPEGCGARTDGRGPVSRTYGGVRRRGAALARPAL
jgi:hypothetical protein